MTSTRLSLGDPILNRMLNGGIPSNRTTLITGAAGTGKSTLAMQFLQEGLQNGEDCLYISTEQTPAEIQDAFSDFSFNLDHPKLTIGTVHARLGDVEGTMEKKLTVQALDGGSTVESFRDIPYEPKYIKKHIEQFGDADRVVLDSVSGLNVMAEDPYRFQRFVLDLLQFLTDEIDATTIMTAEPHGDAGSEKTRMVRYASHGIIEIEKRMVGGSPKRMLSIEKMRGTDHDDRQVVASIDEDGFHVGPSRRSQPPVLKDHHHEAIGIEGFDALCGGGLVKGNGVLLAHDGRVNMKAFLAQVFDHGIEKDYSLFLTTTPELGEVSMRTIFDQAGTDLDELLANDQVFIFDPLGTWDTSQDNVYGSIDDAAGMKKLMRRFEDRKPTGQALRFFNIDAIEQATDRETATEIRYMQESMATDDDFLIYYMNKRLADQRLYEAYMGNVSQAVRTFLAEDGLQFISLEKSPCGFVGSTSLIEYTDEEPFIAVEEPPLNRENPMATEDRS